MSIFRTIIAAVLIATCCPAFAQAPPPVPGLPDAARLTSYTLTASTGPMPVNFAVYGDSTDYQDWVQVWLNGVNVAYNDPAFGWTLTSPTGPLATIPRPITDAVISFNFAQTGAVQIVGARRPRRVSQFPENRGVAARDLNQSTTDAVAMLREMWDYKSRTLNAPPGQTLGSLPPASSCVAKYLGFDASGTNFACLPGTSATGTVVGPATSSVGNLVLWNSTNGSLTKDGGPITAFGLSWVGLPNAAAAWGVLGVTPCAQSEGFTGDVTKSAGSCVTAINYTSSLTGAVSRALGSKLGDSINAADFGVVCDGVTDTRVALQQAINSTPIGGTLRISKQNTTGACIVSKGAGAYALLINQPIHFICDSGVAIQPTSALGTTASVLYVNGNPNGIVIQTIIEGCFIGQLGAATRFGLNGIVFDTTVAGNYLRGTVVKNVFIQAGTSGSGYGIYCNNNPVNNPNGGIYAATLGETSFIEGGIFLGSSGDSITIGPRAIVPQIGTTGIDNNGIYVSLVTGAGNLTFENLNFSQAGGITIDAAYNVFFDKGEYELQSALTGQALINISANAATVTGVRIRNLQMQATVGTPLFLKVSANAQHIVFDGNSIATPTNYSPISNASATFQMGPNFWQVGGAAHVSGTAPANTYGGG